MTSPYFEGAPAKRVKVTFDDYAGVPDPSWQPGTTPYRPAAAAGPNPYPDMPELMIVESPQGQTADPPKVEEALEGRPPVQTWFEFPGARLITQDRWLPRDEGVAMFGHIIDHYVRTGLAVFDKEFPTRGQLGHMRFGQVFVVNDPRIQWYKFARTRAPARPMSEPLLALTARINAEFFRGYTEGLFNGILVNIYRGTREAHDALGPHADALAELGPDGSVVALTLGDGRKIQFSLMESTPGTYPNGERKMSISTHHAQMYAMVGPQFQRIMKHQVLPRTLIGAPDNDPPGVYPMAHTRISLTWRYHDPAKQVH